MTLFNFSVYKKYSISISESWDYIVPPISKLEARFYVLLKVPLDTSV
jgi:hypothetical protein